MTMSRARRRLYWVAGSALLLAVLGPILAPNPPTAQFEDRAYAPPMRVHLFHQGSLRAPFVYRQVLVDRLSRQFADETAVPVPLRWFQHGLVSIDQTQGPLLLIGADPLGRDMLSRLLYGARWSLGVALAGLVGALALGTFVGALAGATGGRVEAVLMWCADFVLALPGAYLVLVLRGMLPPVLTPWKILGVMSLLLAASAWPHVARGVRAIVATERQRDYAEAARAAGAGRWRIAWTLLPAARGFLLVEIVLLLPALLVAEATISFLGLGFPATSASWGTMLDDAANPRLLAEAPWLLAPAAAIFLVTLAAQLAQPPAREFGPAAAPSAASPAVV
jgi:peptide/nickel transport system permease protein